MGQLEDEYSKFKSTQAPTENTDISQEFQVYKEALDGGKPEVPSGPPMSMWDKLKMGTKQGFLGQDVPAQSLPQGVGQAVGKYGPAIGGAMAVGAGTGGLGLIPAVGMAGLGAGGGEAYKQIAQKFMKGGVPPETSGAAANDILKTGVDNMMAELGLRAAGGAFKIIKNMTPEAAFSLLKFPVESFKRAIMKPSLIPVEGPAARAAVEMKGAEALRDVQQGMVQIRKEVGEKIGEALETLHTETKGAKIFDFGPVVKAVRKEMKEAYQVADPTVKALVGKDLERIERILKSLEKDPLKSAKVANRVKQEIQKLSDFTHRGLPEIQSDMGQNILKIMGKESRQMMSDVGENIGKMFSSAKGKVLQDANKAAKDIYDLYDELRPMLSTTKTDMYTLSKKVDRIATDFFGGGLRKQLLEDVGKKAPSLAKPMDSLLDSIAAKPFTGHAAFTPSSSVVALIRSLASPQNVGKAIKTSSSIAKVGPIATPTAKMLTRSAVIMKSPTSLMPTDQVGKMLNDALGEK